MIRRLRKRDRTGTSFSLQERRLLRKGNPVMRKERKFPHHQPKSLSSLSLLLEIKDFPSVIGFALWLRAHSASSFLGWYLK